MGRWIALIALVGMGCKENVPDFQGDQMLDFFPFPENEDCQWQFLNEDTQFPYRMLAEIENIEIVGDRREYTVVYRKDCFQEDATCADGDEVRSLTWSLQGNLGVHLHRGTLGLDQTLAFDPSIRVAERFMKVTNAVETAVGGTTYTSTYASLGDCPVRVAEWDDCIELQLTSSAGPDMVTGSYWVINDFNVVAMQWDGESTRWELSNHIRLE